MSHITEIETMAIQLQDVGAPVSPLQIMTKIICTLPPSYRSFTTAWDSVPAKEKTFALLTSRLLKEETMAKRFNRGQQDSLDATFFASNHSQGPSEFRSSIRGRGGRGIKRGGSSRHHPYQKCGYCDKPNHKQEVCRKWLRDEAAAKRFSDSIVASTPQQPDKEEKGYMSTCSTTYCPTQWFADSGATQHMSNQRSCFKNFIPVKPGSWAVRGIGNIRLSVHGYGSVVFTATVGGIQRNIIIKMVLYVPNLGTNLLSIAAVTDVGMSVHFVESCVSIFDKDVAVFIGKRVGRTLNQLAITTNHEEEVACLSSSTPPSIVIWHHRLAHANYKTISKMANQNLSMVSRCQLKVLLQKPLAMVACLAKCSVYLSRLEELELQRLAS